MDTINDVVLNVILKPVITYLESLSYLGVESHFIKSQYLDDQIQPLADSLGMELTLIKYTLSLFAVYPLSCILYTLPGKHMKNLFSFVVGFCLVQWIFGPDWIHTFSTSLGTYLICLLLPSKLQPRIAFIFVMGYMVMAHIYRMYVSYMSGNFDFTGTQMVLTMKLTSFAYNMYDGIGDKKNVFPEKPHEDPKKAKIYNDRAKFAIRKLPDPLSFFGYIYCFTCILAGPAFEYRDYERAIDGSIYVQSGLQRLLVGLFCLVVHLKITGVFPLTLFYNKEYIATTPYFQRFGAIVLRMFGDRLKFYFAWKLAEGASILGGFGFEGYNAEGKVIGWKGVENADILGVELATNMQTFLRHWNKRTQGWLERYTYNRTGRSLFMTYLVSAIWHGLYPGFFFMFFSFALMTSVERLIKAKINPLIVPGYDGYNLKTYPKGIAGSIYWIVSWIFLVGFMAYVTQVFSMGSLENTLTALGGHHYIPHLLLVVIYAILEFVPSSKKKKI